MSTLTFANSSAALDRLPSALGEWADEQNLPPSLLQKLNLLLEEHLTNVISYGYDDASSRTIEVELEVVPPRLRATVRDDARPYNPLDHPPPDLDAPLEDRAVGGLGIHFIRTLADHAAYRRTETHNELTFELLLE